jgi:glycosyltransferase involved in cell wall biosynthesis
MRILQVSHYMPPHSGGIERVGEALFAGLSRRGHEVRWVASADPVAPGTHEARTRVPAWNAPERRLGLPYPIWGAGAFADLRRLVGWCDVILAHDCLYPGSIAAAALGRLRRRRLLITQHVGIVPFGAVIELGERFAYASVGRAVLSAASVRFAVSAHLPPFFRSVGVDAPFRVVHNAVDVDRFGPASPERRAAARALFGIASDAKVLGFVGRLVAKKGVDRVVGVQRLTALAGTTLLVVGSGPLEKLLPESPATRHVPSLRPEEMPDFYAAIDALLLPSHGEGLPLSVQEALLSGVPVVVSEDASFVANLGGAPGVEHAEEVAALADAVRKTLLVPPAREAIAAWARGRWSEAAFLDTYEQTLHSLSEGAKQ